MIIIWFNMDEKPGENVYMRKETVKRCCFPKTLILCKKKQTYKYAIKYSFVT